MKEHLTQNSISKIPEGGVLSVVFMGIISIRSLYSQHCWEENLHSSGSRCNISNLADKFGIIQNRNQIKTLGFSFEVCENEESIREHTSIYFCVPGEAQPFASF